MDDAFEDDDIELPPNTVIYSLNEDGALEIDGRIDHDMVPQFLAMAQSALAEMAEAYNKDGTVH